MPMHFILSSGNARCFFLSVSGLNEVLYFSFRYTVLIVIL